MVEFIQSLIAAATVPAVDAVGAQETTPEINAEFEALFFSFNLPRSAASATPQTLRNAARDGADALSADADEEAFARPDIPLPAAAATTAGIETEMRSIDEAKGIATTPGASDGIFVRPTKTTNTELIGALPIERIEQNDRHQATTTPAEFYTSNPEVAEPPVAPTKSHGVVVDAVPTNARAEEGAVEAKGGAGKGAIKNEAPAEPAARSAPGSTMTAPPADKTDGAPAPIDFVPAATAFADDKPLRSIASPAAINAEPARPPHFVVVSSAETRDGRIELRLDPPDLGSVHIDVSRDETGLIKAVISTERAETLDVARRHADVFKAELQRLGLGDVDLQFADRGETGASPDQRERPRRSWTATPEFNTNFDRASFVEFDGGRFDVVA